MWQDHEGQDCFCRARRVYSTNRPHFLPVFLVYPLFLLSFVVHLPTTFPPLREMKISRLLALLPACACNSIRLFPLSRCAGNSAPYLAVLTRSCQRPRFLALPSPVFATRLSPGAIRSCTHVRKVVGRKPQGERWPGPHLPTPSDSRSLIQLRQHP